MLSMDNNLPPDLKVIANIVDDGSSILDAGCGSGELMSFLKKYKNAECRGIDLSGNSTSKAIAQGLSVMQGDVDDDLEFYPDNSYDYAIMSKAIQATKDPKKALHNLARIGKKVIISIPNFGYWKNRLYLGVRGKMPVTEHLSYQWHETPNIHFCTIADFIKLCEDMELTIEKKFIIRANGSASEFTGSGYIANLIGKEAVFLINSCNPISAQN